MQATTNRGAEPMDLSKLPKLSDTKGAAEAAGVDPSPEAAAPVPVGAAVDAGYRDARPRPSGVGADVWISTVIGLLFVFMGLTFAKFVVAKLTHHPFDTNYTWPDEDPNGRAGQPVAYFDLQGYTAWTEMGEFLFGLTLLLEAASKAAITLRPGTVSRGLLAVAAVLTLVTVGLNLYACGLVLHYGLIPIVSGLAVAFGGWVLLDEWAALQATRPVRRATGPRAG